MKIHEKIPFKKCRINDSVPLILTFKRLGSLFIMTITSDLETKIARYYYVEKWRVGTIASQLGIHHSTVQRVLSKKGVEPKTLVSQISILDPFLPFIQEQLRQYPKLSARRLYDMACERGYTGGPDHFRHRISWYRPKPIAEAYLRLRTLPGEQAQVDWGLFGHIMVGKAKRALSAFVMVLSFSRKIFLKFYLNQRMESFLRGHQEAFEHFGGVPRVLLYDNLRSAVLERHGDAIRFNPTLLDFSAHYHFEPRPVAVARGNEKGRVERAIRYVRQNFFAARAYKDLEDLNAQAQAWCEGPAAHRPCPEDKTRPVKDVFIEERPKLITLPGHPYPTEEKQMVRVGKTPYVRFDWNDYSVPHTYVQQTLSVSATLDTIRIINGTNTIAEHKRSFDKAQQIENPEHIQTLIKQKKKAKQHRGQDQLIQVTKSGTEFLKQAAAKGYYLRSTINRLLQLLEDYGATELEGALQVALSKQVPHTNVVQKHLEKQRKLQQQKPPIQIALSKDPRIQHLIIKPHDLESYDRLQLNSNFKPSSKKAEPA